MTIHLFSPIFLKEIDLFATELQKVINGLSLKLVSDGFKLNKMTGTQEDWKIDIRKLSILNRFGQSYMAQNHSHTWDPNLGNCAK